MKNNTQNDTKERNIIIKTLKFLNENKRWWLLPIIIVLLMMAAFIILTAGQPILPAVYCLF